MSVVVASQERPPAWAGRSRNAETPVVFTVCVRWKLFADLAEVAGVSEPAVSGEPETVADALNALLADHPALADRVTDADGRLQPDVNLLVNGQRVDDPAATPVESDDELALFPPVSGG